MNLLITKIIKENFFYLLILFAYSTLSGLFISKIFSSQTTSEITMYSFILLFQELTYPAIKNLLTLPIYNNAIKELKKYTLNQIKSKTNVGLTKTKFIKIQGLKNLIDKLFDSYKNILSISGILYVFFLKSGIKNLIINLIFLFLFFICFFFNQKTINIIRKAAWSATENVLQKLQENILNTDDIKQNLISHDFIEDLLDNESSAWNKYYLVSNIMLIFNALFFILTLAIINPYNLAMCYIYIKKSNRLAKNFKTLFQYYSDLSFLKDDFLKKNHETQRYTNNLKITNVTIYNVGPFSFEMKSNILQIHGENGVGKTLLAKAIANLVPFEGIIETPKCIYIGLDSQIINENLSKGQKILKHIDMALEKDYKLFILDEILDILSKNNLEKIIEKLKNKKILIITHKKLPISLNYEQIIIKNNNIDYNL